MCAQFLIRARFEEIKRRYNLIGDQPHEANASGGTDEPHEWPEHILPHRPAPVIVGTEKGRELRLMNFSLVPSWSKERKVKFATHNARIESITEKPTWKEPFLKHHCLIPFHDFIEPIYEGPLAGNMVAFHRKDHEFLTAAGIWSTWVDKQTGEILESFSILTHTPSEFVAKTGHDREPIFLDDDGFDGWLEKGGTPKEILKFLDEHQAKNAFAVEKFRPMKPGWEKRK